MPTLFERRAEIIADHRAMERYEPHWKAEAESGRCISERPIAFVCDDEIVIVGPCVQAIVGGLRQFLATAERDKAKWSKRRAAEAAVEHAFQLIEHYAQFEGDELRLPRRSWNGLLIGLTEVMEVMMTDGSQCSASTTP